MKTARSGWADPAAKGYNDPKTTSAARFWIS